MNDYALKLQCPDWLLAQTISDKRLFVQLAIEFAESILHFVPKGEERPAKAIQAAKNWLDDPTEENRLACFIAAAAVSDAPRATTFAETCITVHKVHADLVAASNIDLAAYAAAKAAYNSIQ